MNTLHNNDLFDSLDDLLEQERTALLDGDLDKVGRLLEHKESLIEDLSRIEEFETLSLQRLQGKMQRNQELLNSALEGIRLVAGRLAALRRVRTTLETYDAKGARKTIEVGKDGAVEKRA